MAVFPQLRQTVLDTTDPRGLAEFYRELLGWRYRNGDEPPADGSPDVKGSDWLVLTDQTGTTRLAFQQVDVLPVSSWPANEPVPQQLHLDTTVPTKPDLDEQHDRVLNLGGRLLYDRSADPAEPLRAYADPSGHPFCIIVSP
jgi:catechol 2,3-dioxygenase-like lactoylglutathione lyase family enzyme